MTSVRIAMIQRAPIFLNLAESLALAIELVREAASRGARLVVVPETWLPGYPVWLDLAPEAGLWDQDGAKALFRLLYENSVTMAGGTLGTLAKAAREHEIFLVIGAHERVGHSLYNTMFFITPEGEILPHRKLVPTYTERLLWGRGDGSTLTTVETPFGTVGGLICWEHWMPLARATMHARHESIHVAQWPAVTELHQMASRHYAFEGGCFVLASGCVLRKDDVLSGFDSLPERPAAARALLASMPGDGDALLRNGGSAVYGPSGQVIAAPSYQRDVVIADLDLGLCAESHMYLDTDGHYSRPDVFSLQVDTRPQANVTWRE